ncbi:MAG: hypothetical protein KGL39_17660 [Patescibacteria group bacterium]|nr:hypothetical protein [Patescibacteria group bacterium]
MNLLSRIFPREAARTAPSRPAPAIIDAIHLAKYIVLERDGRELPILFPRGLQHSEMVPKNGKVVSAGFYQIIDAQTLVVDGLSTSLNLASRPEDAALIRDLLTAPNTRL